MGNILTLVTDRAAQQRDQSRHRAHCRRFAGTIGAEHTYDFTLPHCQANAFNRDGVVVTGLDGIEFEHFSHDCAFANSRCFL